LVNLNRVAFLNFYGLYKTLGFELERSSMNVLMHVYFNANPM